MATNSTSQTQSEQHAHSECEQCAQRSAINTELLAALESLIDNAELDALNEPELAPAVEAARAAIAKATGNEVIA